MLTAAHLLAECRLRQRPLEELADLQPYPQVLLAVPVKEKRPLHEVAALEAAIREANQHLAGGGRLLVRYSGTEALLRIMVEAGDAARAQAIAEHLAQVARQYLT
ncbi:MAG: hypothetical protein RMI39_02135 [Thermoanaerobaculum sp.]|nr:hypothetical protein [Thermoanaerobaculum sp.]